MASHTKAQSSTVTLPSGAPPPRLTLIGKQLLALTQDRKLIATLRQVADPAHEVYAAGSEIDLAGALMAHHTGVVVLDVAALATPAGHLAARLHAQFPDIVLIVAGGSEDQAAVAAQITDGSVHRFLHKPVSEQRVRLFVEAAWRRYAEGPGGPAGISALPTRAHRGAKWWLLAAALAALAAPLLWVGLLAPPTPLRPAASAAPSAAPTSGDATLESLLTRADRALAAGQLVAPPGASAADLYREALRRNARDPRAVNGLEQTIDRLVSDAEGALQDRHLQDAQALADQAHAISPDHPRVAFLMAQIGAQRERLVLDKAQHAAATGNVAGALAVLDDAARGGRHSTLVEEARQQLAQQQVDERVVEFLRRGREALLRGQLIEPPEQSARFLIEAARALAPGDAGVQQATKELLARLQAEAGKALTAGNPDQADVWTSAAAGAGAERADVAALRAEAQRLRGASKADSLAQLTLTFNERLAAGSITEPAADSAKFYLAQLLQADAAHPATQLARTAFDTRVLDEARGALRAQDYGGARRWLSEARAAGADPASIGAVDAAIGAAQDAAQRASSYVSASSMTRTRYVAPKFPPAASQRGIDGWVDLQFLVNTDGSVGELTIVGAQPVGVFEQAALDAVRHWRYQPLMRDGQPATQRARVRLRFAMQR
ncbi:MAG TPA: TonB family protein [Steroidobacteraceae bacterium]|nr:TonB family protein [Steroidobacteraceae bacterium]